MNKISFTVNSEDSLIKASAELAEFWLENKYITVTVHSKRTLDQNAAIRVCYSQIRQHREDLTPIDVERMCKLQYGVPILREDPMHDYVFSKAVDHLPYEKQLKVMDCFKVTSDMTTDQASLMINQILADHPYVSIEK